MGLDMYLSARLGFGEETEEREMGYWRKANAIHGWFVRNCASGVDECQPIFVSRYHLKQLRKDCEEALANKAQNLVTDEERTTTIPYIDGEVTFAQIMERVQQEVISNVLVETDDPLAPTNGFFFGSTVKDEWYYNDLQETVSIIDEALKLPEGWEFIYQASW